MSEPGSNLVRILGPDGSPIASRPRKVSALNGNYGRVAYDAADIWSDTMGAWDAVLWSADSALNPYRDRIVARARDLARNDGWATGALTRLLDNVIGAHFRPISKPDYRALQAYTGNPAFDAKWADEFGRAVESNYRTWANDPLRYCDTQRSQTVPQMMRLAFRHKLIDGDALGMLHWLPRRIGHGKARYATALQIIDPDRLSNPQNRFDQQIMRGGVEVDEYDSAVAYHIRRAHAGDWFNAQMANTWERIPRETEWGRPIIVHDYDQEVSGQHRGGAGIFTPVLQRMKMLVSYDSAELQSAIINSILAAYVESPFDPQMVEDALSDEGEDKLNWYQNMRADFHDQHRLMLNNARVPILAPGEKINAVKAERPNANFGAFEAAVLRNLSAATGLSAQQISNNWSDVNYSSARGALLEAWKTLIVRRHNFGVGFADQVWCAQLEEQFDVDELPLPKDAPEFMECRVAYARCRWMGPGRGWIDPVSEKQGAVLGMDAGLSTLEQECAEGSGEDYEDVLDQRAREIEAFKSRGLEPPTWAKLQTAPNAAKKPQPSETA